MRRSHQGYPLTDTEPKMYGILEQQTGQRTVGSATSQKAKLCNVTVDRVHGRLQKE